MQIPSFDIRGEIGNIRALKPHVVFGNNSMLFVVSYNASLIVAIFFDLAILPLVLGLAHYLAFLFF